MTDEQIIPLGLCHCGCGQRTRIAPYTRKECGWRKGEPLRFVSGHNWRSSKPEYLVNEATGCWVWQRAKTSDGYATAVRDGQGRSGHRVFYEEHVGPIPEGFDIDHLCRNRACVNPSHLEAVTHAENIRRGDLAKLSRAQIAEIRGAAESESQSRIAARFGVGQTTISKLLRGITWQ